VSRPLILFDLTRLLSATGRAAPTGIERVEFQYARWLAGASEYDVRFVATLPSAVRLVPQDSVDAFLERQSQTWADGAESYPARRALGNVNRFLAGERPPRPPRLGHLSTEERRQRLSAERTRGEPRVHPIASWAQQVAATWTNDPLGPVLRKAAARRPVIYLRASGDRLEKAAPFERLKAAGARMVVMTYDTIPLDYPEFVRPKAAALCAERVANMARLSDGIVAISHYSAGRLAPHLAPARPKVTVAHLGVDAPPETALAKDFVDEPFFLVISTIEARKNHALLLNLWRRMVDEMGEATPKLVIAGKRGWEAHAPLAILDRSRELEPYVYEAGAVPDAALDVLRRKATAVLMPSFVEGFGLPVVEALAVDTPVIASDIPAFREVAGEACELIDPLDGPAWRAAICDYAAARSPRREAALARARAFRPPTWACHFAKVRTFLDDIADDAPVTLGARARRVLGTAGLVGPSGGPIAVPGATDRRPV